MNPPLCRILFMITIAYDFVCWRDCTAYQPTIRERIMEWNWPVRHFFRLSTSSSYVIEMNISSCVRLLMYAIVFVANTWTEQGSASQHLLSRTDGSASLWDVCSHNTAETYGHCLQSDTPNSQQSFSIWNKNISHDIPYAHFKLAVLIFSWLTTRWSRILHQKVTFPLLFKKSPSIYGIRIFITVFKRGLKSETVWVGPRSTLKLEDHHLSAFRDWLFSIQ